MDAASGTPSAYVQLKAGHSSGAITERYIHAAAVLFPGAADKAEARMFGAVEVESQVETCREAEPQKQENPAFAGFS